MSNTSGVKADCSCLENTTKAVYEDVRSTFRARNTKRNKVDERCPFCGQEGQRVPNTAVTNLLKSEFLSKVETGEY
ncbi:MAG: hypothetical protein H0Z38_00890 [Firmicutes bacterium]|nr:hypothetical protein [Bacillota bacterium]